MQDLLVYVTKGISAVTTQLRSEEKEIDDNINHQIIVNLFTTITNANFDKESIITRIKETLEIKEELLKKVENRDDLPEAAFWNGTEDTFEDKASHVGILATENEDIRSLREAVRLFTDTIGIPNGAYSSFSIFSAVSDSVPITTLAA